MAKWSSPAQEFIESPEAPTIRELAQRWNIPYDTLRKRSAKARWTEQRHKFATGLAQKTNEKTIEKVAEKVADASAEIIARQVKGNRLAQGVGADIMAKLRATIDKYPTLLLNENGAWCPSCNKMQAVMCMACQTPNLATAMDPTQLVKVYKDLSAALSLLTKEERTTLGLDREKEVPGPTVNVQVIAMQDVETRRMLEAAAERMRVLDATR